MKVTELVTNLTTLSEELHHICLLLLLYYQAMFRNWDFYEIYFACICASERFSGEQWDTIGPYFISPHESLTQSTDMYAHQTGMSTRTVAIRHYRIYPFFLALLWASGGLNSAQTLEQPNITLIGPPHMVGSLRFYGSHTGIVGGSNLEVCQHSNTSTSHACSSTSDQKETVVFCLISSMRVLRHDLNNETSLHTLIMVNISVSMLPPN